MLSRGIAGLTIKVVRQSNKYLGAARNEGLRHANGSFVIFLDDDNVPFPNMVEVFRKAAHVSQADIVTSQLQFLRINRRAKFRNLAQRRTIRLSRWSG